MFTAKKNRYFIGIFFIIILALFFVGLKYIKAALYPGSEWTISISSPVAGQTVSVMPTMMWNFYSCDSEYSNGNMSPTSCNGYSPCHDQYPVAAASARMAANIASYTLHIDDDSGFGSINYTKAGGAEYQHTVTSALSYNTPYYWRIMVTDGYGSTNGDGTDCYVTSGAFYTVASTPAVPILSNQTSSTFDVNPERISGGAESGMAIFVADSAANCNGTVTTNNKYVNSDGSLGSSAVWQTESAWGTKTITGLADSTTYYVCVKARNSQNVETSFGSASSIKTKIKEPANLIYSYLSDSCYNVMLSWTDQSSSESGFKVEQEESTNPGVWTEICSVGSNVVTCTKSLTLTAGVTFNFRVKAYITSPSEDSSWVYSTAYNPDYCPVTLKLNSYSCERVNLSWTAGSGDTPDSYDLMRKKGSGAQLLLQNVSNATFNYSDFDLLSGTSYEYQIVSQSAGRKSNTISVSPCPKSPKWKEVK